MKTYNCSECGDSFSKNQLDPEMFKAKEYFCISCTEALLEEGWDSVDPSQRRPGATISWTRHGRCTPGDPRGSVSLPPASFETPGHQYWGGLCFCCFKPHDLR